MKTIIIIGLTPQGLSLLRILCRAGINVIAYYNSKKNVGRFSKYGKKIYFETINQLKDSIREILSDIDYKPLCYITSGELLAMVLQSFPELYQICDVISGDYETVEKLAHKDCMYEIAVEKGFKVAKYITLDKYKNGDFKFPIFLKRNYEIPLFFKAVKINSQETFNRYFSRIKENERRHILVQEFIDIPKENLLEISSQGFFCNGEAKGFLIGIQKRKLKKGLTAYLKEIDDHTLKTLLVNQCTHFMRDLKYTGFAEFEFMLNTKHNTPFFLEVNTRTCGEQSALYYKFSNIKEVLLNPHNAPDLIEKTSRLRWMNIQRDIRARFEKKDFSNLLDVFKSKYDILDFKDIKPFFRQFI